MKSHGSADVMLSRVLPDGAVDWARGYGGTAEDYPVTFALDGADRISLTGLYNGTGNIGGPDFPAFAGNPGRYDVYVAFVGTFEGTVNFPTIPLYTPLTSAGGADVFVARVSTSGDMSSVVTFGGTGDEVIAQAHLDGAGNVMRARSVRSTSSSRSSTRTAIRRGPSRRAAQRQTADSASRWTLREHSI